MCRHLFGLIKDKEIDSVTRQKIALAEERIFGDVVYDRILRNDVAIIDRFNPVSGYVYGPPEFQQHWVEYYRNAPQTHIPDLIIFIRSSTECIISRGKTRDKKDIYDVESLDNISKYDEKYTEVLSSDWLNSRTITKCVHNNYSLEDAVSQCVEIINAAISEKR